MKKILIKEGDMLNNSFEKKNDSQSQYQSLKKILLDDPKNSHIKLALESFTPSERTALILYYYQEQSEKQIAKNLGVEIETLKIWLDQMSKKLRKKLNKSMIFSKGSHA